MCTSSPSEVLRFVDHQLVGRRADGIDRVARHRADRTDPEGIGRQIDAARAPRGSSSRAPSRGKDDAAPVGADILDYEGAAGGVFCHGKDAAARLRHRLIDKENASSCFASQINLRQGLGGQYTTLISCFQQP